MAEPVHRYRMTVAYDGTDYAGWQVQPEHRTIQMELETALARITREMPRIHGSGRTDSGVHAQAQVAHFDLGTRMHLRKFQHGINAVLPADIRVMSLAFAAPDFHARLSATGKEYRYFIWNAPLVPPFERRYRYHGKDRLDLTAMRAAAALLEGRHDFAAFSANPNRELEGTVREVSALKVSRQGDLVTIRARGNGFLYKMVRSLAGFLLRVGAGEIEPGAAATILASKTRTARVPTAPAEGLFLWKVFY